MREVFTVSQRLSIALGSLATGNAFQDLKIVNTVSPHSV